MYHTLELNFGSMLVQSVIQVKSPAELREKAQTFLKTWPKAKKVIIKDHTGHQVDEIPRGAV